MRTRQQIEERIRLLDTKIDLAQDEAKDTEVFMARRILLQRIDKWSHEIEALIWVLQ